MSGNNATPFRFSILKREMEKKNITFKHIADYLGIEETKLVKQLSGYKGSVFYVDGAFKMQKHFFPYVTMEELFSTYAINWKNPISLTNARILAGYSLKEASQLIGKSVDSIRRYEKNPANTSGTVYENLCKAYGVDVDSILIEV